jgi:hypothetical protein
LEVVIIHGANSGHEEKILDLETPEDILGLSSKQSIDFKNKVARINGLLRDKKMVFWWGAGSSSVIYLSQVEKEIFKKAGLSVIDGDKNKWGLYLPVANLKVTPFTVLKGKKIDYLIIASSFFNEIRKTLRINDILAETIEVFV